MSRRGENIHKRKDGRWEGRYVKEYDLNGKAKYGSVYSKTYLDTKRKLIEKKQSIIVDSISEKDINITLRKVLYLWLENNRIKLKEQTYAKYKRLIETHIIPHAGTIKIRDINATYINRFLYEKSQNGRLDGKGGLSPNYVKTIKFIINSSLKFALQEQLCNTFVGEIICPAKKAEKFDVLSLSEQEILEKYIYENLDDKKIGVLLSLYTGLRIGEVCALKWGDINFEDRTMRVSRTICRIETLEDEPSAPKTKLLISDAKTISSNRVIPVPEKLFDILKNNKKSPDKFILQGNVYPYTDPRTYQYAFHKILKKSGLRHINYHILRHTFATRCIESGMDMKTLSEILGHSTVNITLNIYVHSSVDLKRKQIEEMVSYCGH